MPSTPKWKAPPLHDLLPGKATRKEILSKASDNLRKMRNVMRFLIGNLTSDFSPEHAVSHDQLRYSGPNAHWAHA